MPLLRIIIATAFLWAGGAHATSVTLDFEDLTHGLYSSVQTQGYNFSLSSGCPDISCLEGVADNNIVSFLLDNGTNTLFAHNGSCGPCGGPAAIGMSREDGGPFAIYSMDVAGIPNLTIEGITSGGQSVMLSLTDIGTGDWLDLQSIGFVVSSDDPFDILIVELDNIVVAAVPVPAGLWLFGSGLLLLSGCRRARRSGAA